MTLNAIIANFQTFKLVDLLDIIIISFLIYQLLGIVNRTRAGQLFKGALLVMAVYLGLMIALIRYFVRSRTQAVPYTALGDRREGKDAPL